MEKLLKPGKWMLFDDMTWTMADSPEQQKNMRSVVPDDLQRTPQVKKVFELLVAQHPNFESLRVDGDWGWARKTATARAGSQSIDVHRPGIARRALRKFAHLTRGA
jgi:hypothetical protein